MIYIIIYVNNVISVMIYPILTSIMIQPYKKNYSEDLQPSDQYMYVYMYTKKT